MADTVKEAHRNCAGCVAVTVASHAAAYGASVGYPLRDESAGFHHVVTRGNNKRDIYLAQADYEAFCTLLVRKAREHGWSVVGYALMRNHYHLVLRIGDQGLSTGMCQLNSTYAATFNAFHDRVNHLFGRRYWNRRITTDTELRNVVRYVVQNPVRAGGTSPPEAYPWTSYAGTVGVAYPPIPLARDELLPLFGRTPRSAISEFAAYCAVEAGPVESGPVVSGGSRRFVTRTRS